jgi:hypothetical protein
MGKSIVFWALGLYISLFLGGFLTTLFRRYIIEASGKTDDGGLEKIDDRPWIFGSLERLFFTLAAAISVGGAVIAMMIWVAMKMITQGFWQQNAGPPHKAAMNYLTISMVSMMFALIGGLFCRV